MITIDLCIIEILVPPDGESHHGVGVGHDQHREDVLCEEHEGVEHGGPPDICC
mgnify:CR=1 FL=1